MLLKVAKGLLTSAFRGSAPRTQIRHVEEIEQLRGLLTDRQFKAALVRADELLAIHGEVAAIWHCRAIALEGLGEGTQAEDALQTARSLDPASTDVRLALARVFRVRGAWGSAEVVCREILTLDPTQSEAREILIEALDALNRGVDAVVELSLGLDYSPQRLDWAEKLFDILQQIGMYEEAGDIAQRTLAEHGPGFIGYYMLAIAKYLVRDMESSVDAAHKALSYRDNSPSLYLTLGGALVALDRIDEGIAAYRRALKIRPEYAEAHFHLGMLSLMRHRFREGWPGWERRFQMRRYGTRRKAEPCWSGNSLKGRRLHVMAEQGLGDEVMYASCFNELIDAAESCVIECEPRLETLFRRSFPRAEVYSAADDDAKWRALDEVSADVRIYSSSVPRYLRQSVRDFPGHSGYLTPDATRVDYWKERLRQFDGRLKVGLSWRGGTLFTFRERRTLTLPMLSPLFALPGIEWINLQYGKRAEELASFAGESGTQIHDWPEAIDGTYDETAALVSSLDLVISVCTSVVHLSGALGQPVWVMAARVPEWRYGYQGDTIPWYPSARVFRQPVLGDWANVIARVAGNLKALVEEKSRI